MPCALWYRLRDQDILVERIVGRADDGLEGGAVLLARRLGGGLRLRNGEQLVAGLRRALRVTIRANDGWNRN